LQVRQVGATAGAWKLPKGDVLKISVIGAGYVGLVTAAGFAEVGNSVICVENQPDRLNALKEGQCPIFEPGLQELLGELIKRNLLSFTSNIKDSINSSDVIFVAVGTPQGPDGEADISQLCDAAVEIGNCLHQEKLIVIKSTVPVGTNELITNLISIQLNKRKMNFACTVVSNPEFLKEGNSLNDFRRPDRIIIGSADDEAIHVLRTLYEPFSRNHEKIIVMSPRSAELTKYAANAMLALRISFMNEIGAVAEKLGADIEEIRIGIGSDARIGPDFLYAGIGFGGSCFPKDLSSLISMGNGVGESMNLIKAVKSRNLEQRNQIVEKISSEFENLIDIKIAIWGLSFKPNTDDTRDSPAIHIIKMLLDEKATVCAYDPVVISTIDEIDSHQNYSLAKNPYDAVAGCDVLVLMTEWKEFASPDFARISEAMKGKLVFDGRNIWSKTILTSFGFKYFGVGRS
jgi:UDPglucose 6-dehydrogenase